MTHFTPPLQINKNIFHAFFRETLHHRMGEPCLELESHHIQLYVKQYRFDQMAYNFEDPKQKCLRVELEHQENNCRQLGQ